MKKQNENFELNKITSNASDMCDKFKTLHNGVVVLQLDKFIGEKYQCLL